MTDGEKRKRSGSWKRKVAKSASSGRELKKRVRTARGRTLSSTRWLERQLNDPYVAKARELGYRSRAAFKLLEIDEKFKILKGAQRIVDLGAAPGGWSQVVAERKGLGSGAAHRSLAILAVDILPMEPISGAHCLELDFTSEGALETIRQALAGPVDVVLSDMAAATTGHKQTDHLRIIALCDLALEFAVEVLTPGGVFVAKVLEGGVVKDLLSQMRARFERVRHFKPKASRSDSAEMYVVAMGFKG